MRRIEAVRIFSFGIDIIIMLGILDIFQFRTQLVSALLLKYVSINIY